MAVQTGMFVFEVVVESVQCMVESRCLVIRSEFADIFSLELKDPKTMHIIMPEPLPLPLAPVKKGKKAKPKPKKGKKGKVPPPPPEPVIQSGQSVLFTSSAGFLIQNMKKYPLEVSLWNKEDNSCFIGSCTIPWDPMFITNLEKIADHQPVQPTVLNDSYNIFEEGIAKIMAKVALQIKLTYLGEKVSTAFRTLTEDPVIKRVLYTGINNKAMSYMCNYKTTDDDFENNCNKVENNFTVSNTAAPPLKKINYADYKNAPGADLTNFKDDGNYCCMGSADKPPNSIYKSPETCPDIDFIIDYVRKIIVSCNDNMRMLTPRPTITPRVKATDIDRLCYCRETNWPEGKFAERFKKEATTDPCPLCIKAGQKVEGLGETFKLANIRGPCGRPDCRIARDMRAYIENLVDEDNEQFTISDLVGPCGSKTCTLAEKIQQFIRHEGMFTKPATIEGLSTQCGCIQTMQKALEEKESCESNCSKDCSNSDDEVSNCGGTVCPFAKEKVKVYNVYYFTVELDKSPAPSASLTASPTGEGTKTCSSECPFNKVVEIESCSKSACSTKGSRSDLSQSTSKCQSTVCPSVKEFPPSPADSKIVIAFEDIHNPCCATTCDVADNVKEFIVDALSMKASRKSIRLDADDPCYCDCKCLFKTTKRTTYCPVCGGYECLGEDMATQPPYAKPHPCPVYHKLYDRKIIKTPKVWPDDDTETKTISPNEKPSKMSMKAKNVEQKKSSTTVATAGSDKKKPDIKKEEHKDLKKKKQKKVNKFTANYDPEDPKIVSHNCMKKPAPPSKVYPYPQVPKNMGWNWTAEDIPGMKPRQGWKPGAANKILVRRYRAQREGLDVLLKKKRALMQKKKKIESKPTITVTKKDGEYTVQMEVFKKYSKERLINQYPYEDKPPLIYTIGKTEAEKNKLKSQRDRRERRETRRKSRLLQSTFRDKCQEICLKAYNQAIGMLPLPNPNDPDCPCVTAPDPSIPPPIDSCSCSDEGTISSSDTDNDEWVVEFTAPAAKYDGKVKNPPVMVNNETQYTYLDYKVKILDKAGNQVPRFFKGIDGRELCSDLGGFWGQDHVWQEINKDGYIGPDNRWVPMNFIGPDGMFYSAEEGSFTDHSGNIYKIGVDGYINKEGKWAFYPNRKISKVPDKSPPKSRDISPKSEKEAAKTETKNKEGAKGKETAQGNKTKDNKKPTTSSNKVERNKAESAGGRGKTALVMNTAIDFNRRGRSRLPYAEKMRLDYKKIAKYNEIIQGLQMYEDYYDLRPLMKTNRATQNNTGHISTSGYHKPTLTPVRSNYARVSNKSSTVYTGQSYSRGSPIFS